MFADLDALLEMLWKNHADIGRWAAAGVRVELAEPRTEDLLSDHPLVKTAYTSLARWRARERRRKVIAGLIFSALALLALAILFYFVPAAN